MNSHDYQVNDILVTERGFFYQILKTSPTTITISHISNTAKFNGFCTVRRPNPGVFLGQPKRRKVGKHGYVALDRYTMAAKWAGGDAIVYNHD